MPAWIRNLVMVAVTGAWAAVVATSMIHGSEPSPAVWAVPGATYALLTGGGAGLRKRIRVTYDDGGDDEKTPPPSGPVKPGPVPPEVTS